MARVRLHPLFKHLRGTIKGMVFRLTDHGSISGYLSPDMSRVEWSQDQVSHRERMAEAIAYASQAVRDPEIREIYLQMARKVFKNNPPLTWPSPTTTTPATTCWETGSSGMQRSGRRSRKTRDP